MADSVNGSEIAMTTPQAKKQRVAGGWKPYPELPRKPKDMLQSPAVDYLRARLREILTPGVHYPYHPTILIGGEIPIYYGVARSESAGPPPHVIPDCLVAFDVDTDAIRQRVGYDPEQNGKPPDVVMEVASRTTHANDTMHKRGVYQDLGVPEYWRFDPEDGRLYGYPIIGERLVDGRYERLPLVTYDDGSVGSTSAVLNLNFRWREGRFRIHDPVTGEEYEHPQEENARLLGEIYRLRGEG